MLDYLRKENNYTKYWYKENKVNSKNIFQYYKNSLPVFEEGFKTKLDGYEYYSTASINQEYRKYYRIFKKKKN